MDFVPVSIIIPNFNGEQILEKTLTRVVEAASAYRENCEIIVADDASQDSSVKLIKENFSEVKVVQHETNQGFAEAVHSGVRSSIYEIIILLNSDVRPEPKFIAPLVCWFDREDTFSVSPLILDHEGKPSKFSWNLVEIVRGKMRRRNWNLEEALDLSRKGHALKGLYASGGSMACRKEMFLKLGGFLPVYKPFYDEDLDLGIRAWRRGWQTFFDPESKVVHDHQEGAIKSYFPKREVRVIRYRNRFFSLWLHLSTSKLIFSHIPWTLFRLPWRLIRMDTVYAIALFKALSNLGEVLGLRRDLKKELSAKSWEEINKEIDPGTEPIS
jgi:GT2 family glycosyltransferase